MPGYGSAPSPALVRPGYAQLNPPSKSRAISPPLAGPGLVGVRNQSPRNFVTGQTSQTYRLKYRVTQAATGLRLDFPAWTTLAAGTGDTATGNTVNLGAVYVERSGTLYPVTFNSGASTAAITSGSQVTSDPVAGLTVASGDVLYIRTYVTVTAGGQWPNLYGAVVYPDEMSVPGSNLANGTGDLSGVAGAVNTSLYGPMRIWAARIPGQPTYGVSIDGDSIVAGVNDSFSDESQTGYWQRSLYPGTRPYELVMLPSESGSQFITGQGLLRAGISGDYSNYYVSEYGINDLQQGQTLAQLQVTTLKVALVANDPGIIKKYQQTLGPKSSSTDSWATTANQTTDGINTIRVQFNDWVRDGMPINTSGVAVATGTVGAVRAGDPAHPWQGYLEIADLCESARNSGLWKPGYTNDGLHPGPTGNANMAAAMAPQFDTWFPDATSTASAGGGGGGTTALAYVATGAISSSAFQGSAASQAYTSSTFSPTASSLIVIVAQATESFNNAWNNPTITDSLATHLTWTRLDTQADVTFAGADATVSIFYALCPSAQTNMTVTVTQSLGGSGQTVTFSSIAPFVFTGYDTVPAISLSKGTSTSTTLSVSATPTSANGSFLLLAANNAAAASGASTAGTGDYLAAETHVGTSFVTVWYGGSSGPTVTTAAQTLSIVGATPRWQYIALEIAGAASTVTRSATVPMVQSSSLGITGSQTIGATVALASTSTLAIAATLVESPAVALAQSSSLGVGPLIVETPAVAMAGSSSMAITPSVTETPAVALAQSSGLVIAPLVTHSATVALGQSSTMGVTALNVPTAAVTLAQTSGLAVTGQQTIPAVVTFGSSSSLSVSSAGNQSAAVAFDQSSTLAVAPLVVHPYAVAFAQSSALTVAGLQTISGSVTLASTSTLAITPTHVVTPVVALGQTSSLAVTGRQTIPVTVAFSQSSTVTVSVQGQQQATVAMTQSSALSVAGAVTHAITAAMAQSSALAVAATVTQAGTIGFGSTSALTVTGVQILLAAVLMAQTSALTVVASTSSVDDATSARNPVLVLAVPNSALRLAVPVTLLALAIPESRLEIT